MDRNTTANGDESTRDFELNFDEPAIDDDGLDGSFRIDGDVDEWTDALERDDRHRFTIDRGDYTEQAVLDVDPMENEIFDDDGELLDDVVVFRAQVENEPDLSGPDVDVDLDAVDDALEAATDAVDEKRSTPKRGIRDRLEGAAIGVCYATALALFLVNASRVIAGAYETNPLLVLTAAFCLSLGASIDYYVNRIKA